MNLTSIISKKYKTEAQNEQQTEQPFLQFIWQEKRNRRFLWIALAGTIVQFIIFKILYPFADFFSDSYSYIFAAKVNLDVSIWPIGYSKFLRWFHFITYSDTSLISFQYFFLELSCLYFFFTILHFYNPVKINQIILFVFLFFNPLFLYISNYVNSDPVFIALSLLWFSELLWILHRPNVNHIIIQALLLFAAFTVRNNAYIYPFITAVAFALSRLRLWVKVSGAMLGILLIIPFIIHTRNAAYKMTGTKMFSFFTGWQLANNALYIWEYADSSKTLSVNSKELEKSATQFYSMVPKNFRSDYLFPNPGNFFIQHPASPLKLYLNKHYRSTDDSSNVVAWGQASALFEEYGKYIITNNKKAYLYEFMAPNIRNYFVPHLEKLSAYNLGQDKVDPLIQEWFHYSSDKLSAVSFKSQGVILYIFPYLFLMLNTYWLMSIVIFCSREKYKATSLFYNKYILLIASFFIANLLFSAFATIIVLRYQVFALIICTASCLLMTEWLEKKQANKKSKEIIKESNALPETKINLA